MIAKPGCEPAKASITTIDHGVRATNFTQEFGKGTRRLSLTLSQKISRLKAMKSSRLRGIPF
jgi:hypothetical protein